MPKLLRLLNDPDSSVDAIADLIQLDAGLTAKLIGIANSAYYGSSGCIADVDDAVNRLGFREIYRTVTLICSKSFVGQSLHAYHIESDERWYNSVATGLVMELLSQRLRIGDSATAYTIGLLHDIGKLAIHNTLGEVYANVLQQVEMEGISLVEGEKRAFGFDHAEAGAALLASWDFPIEIHEAIGCQYAPSRAKSHPMMAAMLHVSRWICAGIGGIPGKHAWAFSLEESVFETLGLSPEAAMELMIDSKEQLKIKESLLSQ
jgi:putative nucleotidyltransferase with HDIG domain